MVPVADGIGVGAERFAAATSTVELVVGAARSDTCIVPPLPSVSPLLSALPPCAPFLLCPPSPAREAPRAPLVLLLSPPPVGDVGLAVTVAPGGQGAAGEAEAALPPVGTDDGGPGVEPPSTWCNKAASRA